jgi:hypothetical protein
MPPHLNEVFFGHDLLPAFVARLPIFARECLLMFLSFVTKFLVCFQVIAQECKTFFIEFVIGLLRDPDEVPRVDIQCPSVPCGRRLGKADNHPRTGTQRGHQRGIAARNIQGGMEGGH